MHSQQNIKRKEASSWTADIEHKNVSKIRSGNCNNVLNLI
jgi:hypothetical protein